MANNLIADLEALLEGFRDDILTEVFILNVHNRVVEVRIECGACGSVVQELCYTVSMRD